MEPMTMMALAGMVPAVAGMFMNNGDYPSGPNYSQANAYMNSPEMAAYRRALMGSAFNPQTDIYNIASDRAYAQANRAAASRGLGNSGAGLGYVGQMQNDLANQFTKDEFQRRLQAYQTVSGQQNQQAQMAMQMANSQYGAGQDNYNNNVASTGAFLGGLGQLANMGVSAYNYSNNQDMNRELMNAYIARTPGYGGAPSAGSVYGAPIASGGYNYGFGG